MAWNWLRTVLSAMVHALSIRVAGSKSHTLCHVLPVPHFDHQISGKVTYVQKPLFRPHASNAVCNLPSWSAYPSALNHEQQQSKGNLHVETDLLKDILS